MTAARRLVWHAQVASTNDAARDPALGHGDVVLAEEQTAGRGQQGNRWASEAEANLTFSVVLEPRFLPAGEQFFLLQAVSLAVADSLTGLGLRPRIKWPNDLYIADRKIAGLLIENDIKGSVVARSIAGIGLNVNQLHFPEWVPNPTSVALETGARQERSVVFERFYAALLERYEQLKNGLTERLEADYHALLYRLDEPHAYRIPDSGETFTAILRHVAPSGELTLEHLPAGERRSYLFKQVEFLQP